MTGATFREDVETGGRTLTSWIVVIALYLLGMGLFHLLGGLGAAGEWFQRWGETSATKRARRFARSSRSSQ